MLDKSNEADARRFRWILDGNGFFMEENALCTSVRGCSEEDQDYAREVIDAAMVDDGIAIAEIAAGKYDHLLGKAERRL